jgi:hypothetical protein
MPEYGRRVMIAACFVRLRSMKTKAPMMLPTIRTSAKVVQRRATSSTGAARVPPLYGINMADFGAGQAMPIDVRAKMEGAFGVDFSTVRIHEGDEATAIGAQAYTRGGDIYFAPGQYQPRSPSGQGLLGHELAHVIQQAQGRVQATPQARGSSINEDPTLEREADEWGTKAARGERVRVADNQGSSTTESGSHGETAPVQRKGSDKVPWNTVDVTFNAWWKEYGGKPDAIARALQRTREQIGPSMPSDYVPPPLRVKKAPAVGATPPSKIDDGPPPPYASWEAYNESRRESAAAEGGGDIGPLPAPDYGTLDPKDEDPAHPLGGWEGLGGVPFMIPSDVGKEVLNPKVPAGSRIPGIRKAIGRAGAAWDLYDTPQTLYDSMLAPLINNVHRPNQAARAQYSMMAIESELIELHQAMAILTDAGLATEADQEWAMNQQLQLEDEHARLQDLLDSGALQGPFKSGWPAIEFIPGGSLLPQIEPGTKTFDDAERLIRFKDIGDCPRCDERPFKGTVVDQNRLR